MHPIALAAERILHDHPSPALRVGEILPYVAERVDRTLTARRLEAVLSEHPQRFRILDPWVGPWRQITDPHARDAWIVLVHEATPSGRPDSPRPQLLSTLRESIRWLARSIDSDSPSDVWRCCTMLSEERAVRDRLVARD